MGLISGVLLFPITGPVWAFRLFLERLREEAEAVLRDEGRAFAELIDLSMRHNAGQLTDAEFEAQETELLEHLSSIREYRDELLHTEFDASEYEPDDEQGGDEESEYAPADDEQVMDEETLQGDHPRQEEW